MVTAPYVRRLTEVRPKMPHNLEAPCPSGTADWAGLYRTRGDEDVSYRPVLTGDVFADTPVLTPQGNERTKTVMVVQHPCALRSNGVDLIPRLLVAEVRPHKVIDAADWTGSGKVMPLPELKPHSTTEKQKHHAAFLDALYLADPERRGQRIACLEPLGVNLLLQRWVHYNSRVVVQTHTYNEVTAGPYEEADLTEDWCEARLADGLDVREATKECLDWLREPHTAGGPTRQDLLVDPQRRAPVRAAARQQLRSLRTPSDPT
jgi:hypothetical protein